MLKLNNKLILIAVIVGCGFLEAKGDSESKENMVNFKIETIVESNNLKIKYTVSNEFKKDVWICEDVEAYSRCYDLPVTLNIMNDALFVSLKRWEVPDNIYYEEWPVTNYKRLKKGETIENELVFQLPVSDRNPIIDTKIIASQKQIILKKVIFELGFYLEDLSKLKGEHSKYDPNTDTAYVHYFWKNVKKEKILTETTEEISISAVIKKYEK